MHQCMNQNNTHTKIQVCRTIDFLEQNQYDCVIIYLKYFAIQDQLPKYPLNSAVNKTLSHLLVSFFALSLRDQDQAVLGDLTKGRGQHYRTLIGYNDF